jgi:hypothetical protein
VTVTVTARFIREANSVQKSTRGQHVKTSRGVRRIYFFVIFGDWYNFCVEIRCQDMTS